MDNNQIKRLAELAQLDVDATHAYEQAIKAVEVPEIRSRLQEYLADHQRHYDELSRLITQMGGEAPERKRDFKGFVIEGMTALRAKMGTEQALKAMKMNEELTNRRYDQARQGDFSGDALGIVTRAWEDERRHLEYIEQTIANKVWKR